MISKKTAVRAGASFFAVPAAMVMAAGPSLAAGSDVIVTNTETVQAYLSATGRLDVARVYDQLALKGKGKVSVSNPVETKGLRNLDSFGGFEVKDGNVVGTYEVDGDLLRAVDPGSQPGTGRAPVHLGGTLIPHLTDHHTHLGLTDQRALFASDAAPTGWTGADQAGVQPGDVVAVWGAGGVGQMAARAAMLMGAERVVVIDRGRVAGEFRPSEMSVHELVEQMRHVAETGRLQEAPA